MEFGTTASTASSILAVIALGIACGMGIKHLTNKEEEEEHKNNELYFQVANPDVLLLNSQDTLLTLKVVRTEKQKAEFYRVVREKRCSDRFALPDSIYFAADQKVSQMKIACSGFPKDEAQELCFSLLTTSKKEAIAARMKTKVVRSEWTLASDSAVFTFKETYDTIRSRVFQLEGQPVYYIENFLNSGYNLHYIVPPTAIDKEGDKEIIVNNIGYYVTDSKDKSVIIHLWDYELDSYISWTPQRGKPGIKRCYIYNYYPDKWYSYIYDYKSIDDKEQHVYACFYFWMYYNNGASGWNWCTMNYKGHLQQ